MRPLPWILPAVLAPGPASADVSIFQGPPGGPGDVVVVDETGGNPDVHPLELQGIQLLAIDFTGRAALTELLPGRSFLREDVPGAGRIVLPGERGSLYRYRRDEGPGGPAHFGFFLVDAAGTAASVWEILGTGPFETDDPFAGRVAVAPSGDSFLVATTPAAGGDLFEVDLATRTALNRTTTLGPQTFQPAGLCLLTDWGVAVTSTALLRFERLPGVDAAPVPFAGGPPAHLGDGAVHSANESTVALVAGTSPTQAHVHVLGRTGSTRRVTSAEAPLSGPGFLPASTVGPTLALSPNGRACAWVTEGAAREAWIRSIGSGEPPELQITSDARFADTLNDTGTIAFVSLSLIVLLAGERDGTGTGAIQGADLYVMEFPHKVRRVGGGALYSLRNLTGTSGDLAAPFLAPGTIDSDDGVHQLSQAGVFLAHTNVGGGDGALVRADVRTRSVETVLDQVKSLDSTEAAGNDLFLVVRRSLVGDPTELFRLPIDFGAAPASLAMLPDGFDFPRTSSRDDGTVVGVAKSNGDEWLTRIDLPSESLDLYTSQPRVFGPTAAFATDGTVFGSVVLAGGDSQFFAWPPVGPAQQLPTGPTEGFLLPGI